MMPAWHEQMRPPYRYIKLFQLYVQADGGSFFALHFLDLDKGETTHQFAQFFASVVAWVECRAILENQATDASERSEAVIACGGNDGLAHNFRGVGTEVDGSRQLDRLVWIARQ